MFLVLFEHELFLLATSAFAQKAWSILLDEIIPYLYIE